MNDEIKKGRIFVKEGSTEFNKNKMKDLYFKPRFWVIGIKLLRNDFREQAKGWSVGLGISSSLDILCLCWR